MRRRGRLRAATARDTEKRRNLLAFSDAVARPNPSLCAKRKAHPHGCVFCFTNGKEGGFGYRCIFLGVLPHTGSKS